MNRMRSGIFKLLMGFFVIACLIASKSNSIASTQNQLQNIDAQVAALLETLTPEERIGQLFLVTFQGTDVGPETKIYDLITNYHISGVKLSAENNNFTASTYNLNDLNALINQLQLSKYTDSKKNQDNLADPDVSSSPYIPLFIGISQEGGGYPNDQILNGFTPIPSQLSIGATWDTNLAYQVGRISGQELSDVGFNLLFGPSLDVLENPLLQGASQLGTRSFGGDPYWVGEMGKAYIRGLQEGSSRHLAVVATHFPGLGSADHIPQDEVATVRKSLEQLKQIELAPFFVVTGQAITDTERVSALLTSHIRYQGLQGNIRSTTRPIGFDQQALTLLMELPAFASWRNSGGVMVSDDLGSRAVRRFYDPTEQEFNARRLALDAFLAGNDLLYVNQFIEAEDPDTYTTIVRTLDFFTQKYKEDPLFAERVNQSVTRILTLKFQLFGEFELDQVVARPDFNKIGFSSEITYDVAQKGVTLISPSLEELDAVLPGIPGRNEFIVFITDDSYTTQCDECPQQPVLAVDTLSKAVMRLYGPQAGGLVTQFYLRSFSYAQLIDLLNDVGDNSTFLNDMERSNWIVFLMQDITESRPASIALKRFLSERPDLVSNKKIIVFTTSGPNYLDSTDISKLTAYFGLFSKIPPYIDIAARVLFKEIPQPPGSLPLSVPGVGYDLILATSSDPDQTIPLLLDIPEWTLLDELALSDDLPILGYRVGDPIPLRTGIILDTNNHPVPNNTPVQIVVTVNGEAAPGAATTTINGAIRTEYLVNQSGTLSIQVQSGLAKSNILIFESPEQDITPQPTLTLTATTSPTLEPSPTNPVPTPIPVQEPVVEEDMSRLEDWLSAIAVASFVSWGAARTGALLGKVRWGIRWGLGGFIGALTFYTYVVLELPGSATMQSVLDDWVYFSAAFLGGIVGWTVVILVLSIKDKSRKSGSN